MASDVKRRKTSNKSLHEAVVIRDRNKVEKLLVEALVDPNDTQFAFSTLYNGPKTGRERVQITFLGVSALHVAVLMNDLQMVQLLINSRVDLNLISGEPHGLTPLQMALFMSHIDLAELLLESGADLPEQKDKEQHPATPGHSPFGRLTLERMLLSWSKKGDTFLHFICSNIGTFNESTVRRLVDYGLDINALNTRKDTPLHSLVNYGSGDTLLCAIDVLVQYGADVTIRNKVGRTALVEATLKGHPFEVLKKLTFKVFCKDGLKGINSFANILRHCHHKDVCSLLEDCFESDARVGLLERRPSTLFSSVPFDCWRSLDKISFLLKKGLRPEVSVIRNWIKRRDVAVSEVLLENCSLNGNQLFPPGFRYVVNTIFSYNPIHANSHRTIIEMLLKKGLKAKLHEVKYYLEFGDLGLVELILKYQPELSLRQLIPDALILLVSGNNRVIKRGSPLALIRVLIEKFHLDPNYSSDSRALLPSLIDGDWNEKCKMQSLDYLIGLNILDLNVCGLIEYDGLEVKDKVTRKLHTPLAVALNNGHYKVAAKLLRNLCSFGDYDMKGMPLKPAISRPLIVMFYAGHRLPQTLLLTDSQDEREKGSREINWFNEWLEEKRRCIFPLQRIAGNAVREFYGARVKDLIAEMEFPPEIRSILLLNDIRDEYKETEELKANTGDKHFYIKVADPKYEMETEISDNEKEDVNEDDYGDETEEDDELLKYCGN